MICPSCESEGQTSTVTEGPSSRTMTHTPPFHDEQGRRHVHDSNRTTTEYRCSNGHAWSASRSGSCWCGWEAP